MGLFCMSPVQYATYDTNEDSPLRYVVQNTFIHIIDDEPEQPGVIRPRAISEYTGACMEKKKKNRESQLEFPPNNEEEEKKGVSVGASTVESGIAPGSDIRTTIMMRNIPNAYTSSSFVELLDANGFWGSYDFVYLPIDFRTHVNLGYAFINFVSNTDAQNFKNYFDGFQNWFCHSPKISEVTWTDPQQGLWEHVERYRNSPVMHEDVADSFKPRIYCNGQQVQFPPPTKRIRPPRIRPQKRNLR